MIRSLAILGPGTLGCSLAAWAARCGLEVRLCGRDMTHAQEGVQRIRQAWSRDIAKGRLPGESRMSLEARLKATGTLSEALDGAQAFLEALPEDTEVKRAAWKGLAPQIAPGTLALTGTSAIPLARLQPVGSPVLLGFHLFVPVDRMAVVELALPSQAAETDVVRAEALGRQLGKQVVRVRDQPGFAASRMALAQGLEAMRLLERGVATASGLDDLMRLGYGHPVGPLELSDRIGLDLRLRIAEQIWSSEADPRFKPPALLRDLVSQGHVGRAAGRGIYRWTPEREDP